MTTLLTPIFKTEFQELTCCQTMIYLEKGNYISPLISWIETNLLLQSITLHIEFLTECNEFSRKRFQASSFTWHTTDSQNQGGRYSLAC